MIGLLLAAHLYTVEPGDTLSGMFGNMWPTVCEENHLQNCNLIYPGETISAEPTTETTSYTLATSATRIDPGVYSGFQACVIARESGGDASAVNPSSGAGGLYQFLPSTWASLGYGGLPEYAPVWEQNQAFEREYAIAGTSPWSPYDGCLS